MDAEKLERYMLVAHDTKKVFHYFRDTGFWAWSNRGEEEIHTGYSTFWDALTDAVGPYVEEGPE